LWKPDCGKLPGKLIVKAGNQQQVFSLGEDIRELPVDEQYKIMDNTG
jgi:hypothetical protein